MINYLVTALCKTNIKLLTDVDWSAVPNYSFWWPDQNNHRIDVKYVFILALIYANYFLKTLLNITYFLVVSNYFSLISSVCFLLFQFNESCMFLVADKKSKKKKYLFKYNIFSVLKSVTPRRNDYIKAYNDDNLKFLSLVFSPKINFYSFNFYDEASLKTDYCRYF